MSSAQTAGIVAFWLFAAAFFAGAAIGQNRGKRLGYKEACKDFYMGTTKMDLVQHKDGTKTWEWKEE